MSQFPGGQSCLARALSQNTYPNISDDVEIGLNGVIILKKRSEIQRDVICKLSEIIPKIFLCTCIFTDENRLDNFNQNGRQCSQHGDYMKMNVVTAMLSEIGGPVPFRHV